MNLWRRTVLGYIGGVLYLGVELAYRGRSHPSMFLLGGLCFVLVGDLGRWSGLGLLGRAVLGGTAITVLELLTGLVVNRWLGLGVWDYSTQPGNLLGQICPGFCLAWVLLAGAGVMAEDWLRHRLFGLPRQLWRLPGRAVLPD